MARNRKRIPVLSANVNGTIYVPQQTATFCRFRRPNNQPSCPYSSTNRQFARPAQEKKLPNPRKKARVDGGDGTKRSDGAAGAGGRKRPRAPSWERDYQQIWKAVTDLGSEQFTGKEKKAYEARKIVERGGRVGGGGIVEWFHADLVVSCCVVVE